jgi:hypothetical protein
MTMFRESDRREFTEKDEDGEDREYVVYENTAKNIKQRLDVMGFSLHNIEKAIQDNIPSFMEDEYEDKNKFTRKEKEVLTSSLLSDWISACDTLYHAPLKSVFDMDIEKWDIEKEQRLKQLPVLAKVMLGNDPYGWIQCFPGDLRAAFRLCLENRDNDLLVRVDVSEAVGWSYGEGEKICSDAIKSFSDGFAHAEKIIILTEGPIDTWILNKSLESLYPHLKDFYSFIDFSNFKVDGGFPNRVANVKMLAGSEILNRVIALFDNDTAGLEACNILSKVSMPDNIKVLRLPDIEIAKSYPTIGPTGLMNFDINGKACGIEMFLGADVLKDDKNNFLPVVWGGYNAKIGQYQGKVEQKEEIQKKFKKKVGIGITPENSPELIVLWEHVFKAFS